MTEAITAIGLIAAATISAIAALFAAKAEKNSRPVSNGFADGIRTDVREIRTLLIEHLKDHPKPVTRRNPRGILANVSPMRHLMT